MSMSMLFTRAALFRWEITHLIYLEVRQVDGGIDQQFSYLEDRNKMWLDELIRPLSLQAKKEKVQAISLPLSVSFVVLSVSKLIEYGNLWVDLSKQINDLVNQSDWFSEELPASAMEMFYMWKKHREKTQKEKRTKIACREKGQGRRKNV